MGCRRMPAAFATAVAGRRNEQHPLWVPLISLTGPSESCTGQGYSHPERSDDKDKRSLAPEAPGDGP